MLKETLQFALERKRPHGGRGEEQLARYIEHAFSGRTFRDEIGNVHLDLRGADSGNPSRTLFVAHMDTVHRKDGGNNIRKDGSKWFAHKAVLGADDGAGVAMLCHMAHNGVPGYYIFTRGEERGGIGSSWIVENTPDLLRQFDRAIAFDRKGTSSVITEQGFRGKCASNTFAYALADELMNARGDTMLLYMPDDTGVYTDTAEFVDHIPECTNISVGYEWEHSDREELDLDHFEDLARTVLLVRWEELPVERDPLAEQLQSLARLRSFREDLALYSGRGGESLLVYGTRGIEEYESDELDEKIYSDSIRTLRADVYDALDAAEMGRPGWLKELIAYNAFSDSEAPTALTAMGDLRIPQDVLDGIWDELETSNPVDALAWAADRLALV